VRREIGVRERGARGLWAGLGGYLTVLERRQHVVGAQRRVDIHPLQLVAFAATRRVVAPAPAAGPPAAAAAAAASPALVV